MPGFKPIVKVFSLAMLAGFACAEAWGYADPKGAPQNSAPTPPAAFDCRKMGKDLRAKGMAALDQPPDRNLRDPKVAKQIININCYFNLNASGNRLMRAKGRGQCEQAYVEIIRSINTSETLMEEACKAIDQAQAKSKQCDKTEAKCFDEVSKLFLEANGKLKSASDKAAQATKKLLKQTQDNRTAAMIYAAQVSSIAMALQMQKSRPPGPDGKPLPLDKKELDSLTAQFGDSSFDELSRDLGLSSDDPEVFLKKSDEIKAATKRYEGNSTITTTIPPQDYSNTGFFASQQLMARDRAHNIAVLSNQTKTILDSSTIPGIQRQADSFAALSRGANSVPTTAIATNPGAAPAAAPAQVASVRPSPSAYQPESSLNGTAGASRAGNGTVPGTAPSGESTPPLASMPLSFPSHSRTQSAPAAATAGHPALFPSNSSALEPSRKNEIGAESPAPANPAADKAETKTDQPNLMVVQYQNLPPAAYAQEQARRPAARNIAEVHLSPPAVSAPAISSDQPANQVHAGDNEKIVAAIEREVARIEKTTPLTQDQKDRLRRGLSKKLAKRLARSATLERASPSPAQTGSTAAAEDLFQEMKRENAWPENSVEEFSMLASETEAEVKRILSESLEASASLEFLGVESASLFQRVREAHHRFLRKR